MKQQLNWVQRLRNLRELNLFMDGQHSMACRVTVPSPISARSNQTNPTADRNHHSMVYPCVYPGLYPEDPLEAAYADAAVDAVADNHMELRPTVQEKDQAKKVRFVKSRSAYIYEVP